MFRFPQISRFVDEDRPHRRRQERSPAPTERRWVEEALGGGRRAVAHANRVQPAYRPPEAADIPAS